MSIFSLLNPSEEAQFKKLILFRLGNNISELDVVALDKLLRKMNLPVTTSYNTIKISTDDLLDFSSVGRQKVRGKRIAHTFSGQWISFLIFASCHYFIYLFATYCFTKGLGMIAENSANYKIWLVSGGSLFLSTFVYLFWYKIFLSNCSYLKFRISFLLLGVALAFLLPLPNNTLEWKWHLLPLFIVIGNGFLNTLKIFLFDKKLRRDGFMCLEELLN